MYQGKFDAKSRGQQAPEQALDEIIRERDEANAAAAAKRAQRDAARRAARPGSAARAAGAARAAWGRFAGCHAPHINCRIN